MTCHVEISLCRRSGSSHTEEGTVRDDRARSIVLDLCPESTQSRLFTKTWLRPMTSLKEGDLRKVCMSRSLSEGSDPLA